MTTAECKRHGFSYGKAAAKPGGYYVERCAHVDSRFVVEVRPADGHQFVAVDFVEDDGEGHPHLIEAHTVFYLDQVGRLWDELTTRMREGVAPEPDRS